MKRLLCALLACILAFGIIGNNSAEAQTKREKRILKAIVRVCADNWDKMHGYASTCAMMAYQESGCGKKSNGYNLWGINSGRSYYGTIEEGIKGWLRVINLDYYENANTASNGDEQLYILLEHGYCQPPRNYYSLCMKLKSMYNLGDLDRQMFAWIKKRKAKEKQKREKNLRKKRQNGDFKIVFDADVPIGTCVGDPEYIKKGSTVIFGYGQYEVAKTKKHLGNKLIIGKSDMFERELFSIDKILDMSNERFKLQEVIEDAKG